jgi:hypothetical protein
MIQISNVWPGLESNEQPCINLCTIPFMECECGATSYQALNLMPANLAGWESTCPAERVVVLDTISI